MLNQRIQESIIKNSSGYIFLFKAMIDGEIKSIYCNGAGDGLWIDQKQIRGTCDFTIRGGSLKDTNKIARAKRELIKTHLQW